MIIVGDEVEEVVLVVSSIVDFVVVNLGAIYYVAFYVVSVVVADDIAFYVDTVFPTY